MRIITASDDGFVLIGKQGENAAAQVQFPVVEEWTQTYGSGVFQLLILRPTEATPYAVPVTNDGTNVLWTVGKADVAIPGIGGCELRYVVDGTVAKSQSYVTLTDKSIGGSEAPYPTPWEEWVDQVLDAAASAEADAGSAAASASAAQTAQAAAETAQTAAETAQTAAEAAKDAADLDAALALEAKASAQTSASAASQDAADAAAAQAAAAASALSAESSADAASYSASAAQTAQTAAETAQTAAETAQAAAEAAEDTVAADAAAAAEAKNTAVASASAAASSEEAAAASETAAEAAQGLAEAAQTAAETAQGKAEDAQTVAETAQTAAETAQTAAETAQGLAEAAQAAAEAAAATLETDTTLTVSGKAADAKVTGDDIRNVDGKVERLIDDVQASGNVVSFDGIADFSIRDFSAEILPWQTGTGDPSPENIRPLNGYTGITIYKAGRNLFDKTTYTNNRYLKSDGTHYTLTGAMISGYIPVRAGETYFHTRLWSSNVSRYAAWYDANKSLISTWRPTYYGGSGTAPENAAYVRYSADKDYLNTLMIGVGSNTGIPYESYNMSKWTITFPEEAGLVYGGSVEVDKNGDAILTVRPYYAAYNGETLVGPWISDRDVYEEGTSPTTGAQVVDLGGTETTYTVEGVGTLTSITGRNNIWTTTGETSLIYKALPIDAALTEAGKAADAKATGDKFAETGDRIDGVNRLLLDGYSLKITSDDLKQQGFTTADGISSSTTRIGLKTALPVREGTRILWPYTGLYYMIWFLRSPDLYTPDVISNISWARLTEAIVPEGCTYIYTAIANGSNSGTSTTIVPSDFTGEITVIDRNHIDSSIAELKAYVDNGDVPTYVVEESDRVADKVRNVQTGSSLTFAAISDMHYNVDDSAVAAALIDMRDAVNKIKTQVNVDFFASFGDITYRLSSNGSYTKGKAECIAATRLLGECFGDAPQIRMIGNHDPNSEASTGYFTANQMGAYASVFSSLLTVRDEDHPYAGIGWHDFERQKLRVIALDTSFYDENTRPTASATYYSFGNAQAYWLCQAIDLSAKEDADEWQIVTVSHIQIDLSDTAAHAAAIGKYSAVLDAYVKGGSWSAGDYSYDFSGKNAATLALCIHGHSHLYNVRNVLKVNSSAVVQNTLPVADLYVPNALPGREGTSMDGVTYTKTAGTAESTAFQMITLDSVNKIVYAHHYGAGTDIILHYASTTDGNLTTGLDTPVWGTKNSAIATVDGGTVTPVADGDVVIYAVSETDNTIEAWNYHADV